LVLFMVSMRDPAIVRRVDRRFLAADDSFPVQGFKGQKMFRGILNPQRLDMSETLRVGTTRAPAFGLKFKLSHC
jgi:hypothetical protein